MSEENITLISQKYATNELTSKGEFTTLEGRVGAAESGINNVTQRVAILEQAPVAETTIPADDKLKHNHLYILASVDGLDLSSVTVEDYATVDLWIDYTAGTVTTSSDWSWVDGIELPATMSAGTRYMIELRNTGEAILAKLNYSYTNVNN